MSAAQALAGDPDVQVAISNRPYFAWGRRRDAGEGRGTGRPAGGRFAPDNPNARLAPAASRRSGPRTQDCRA